jgi:glutamyl-tRNA reductase
MVATSGDALVALVTHARHVPADERVRFAAELRDESAGQLLVLETCHRAEAYLVRSEDELRSPVRLPIGGRVLDGETAIRHAIAVAVGRDSVVIGEDQILHQLRASVDAARRAGRLHPVLERLFALALRAGRRARSWRDAKPHSLADVAVSAIERRVGPISGREVLIVGAGRMGRLAARAVVAAGATVWLANRSHERTIPIVAETGARIEAFDPGPAIDRFAAVIVALSGPWAVGRATVEALATSSTVVVDLSVPAAVPSTLDRSIDSRLISADSLALTELDATPVSDRTVARLDALIDGTAAEFRNWLELRGGRMAAAALAQRVERERSAELDLLWRRLPDIDDNTRETIERMSRHLTRRLLREPLERLGRDADGRHERAVRELFGL